MAKPGGSTCNLDCAYCYYLCKEALSGGPGLGRWMTKRSSCSSSNISRADRPGNRLFLAGRRANAVGFDFFRRVVALQSKYKKSFQRIENDLQTNGVLFNEEWADF